jgi:hypothetical protein
MCKALSGVFNSGDSVEADMGGLQTGRGQWTIHGNNCLVNAMGCGLPPLSALPERFAGLAAQNLCANCGLLLRWTASCVLCRLSPVGIALPYRYAKAFVSPFA